MTRRLLFAATMVVAATLIGSFSPAYAACTNTSGTTFLCSGATTGASGILITTDNAHVQTAPGFSVDVTSGTDDALQIRGLGALSYTDTNHSSLTSAGAYGLEIYTNGDDTGTGTPGSVTVDSNGNISGYYDGIHATSSGSGAMNITTAGDVTGRVGNGIAAFSASDLTITTGPGTVSGVDYGIFAFSNGSGAVNVTTKGNVTSTNAASVYASTIGANIKITVGKNSRVENDGTDSSLSFGIRTDGGPSNVTIAGTVKGGAAGAIQFDQSGTYSNMLTLDPGATITGKVLGGTGSADTFALGGSGYGTFDLGDIDTGANTQQYRDFEEFEVDSGTWSFSGATTEAFTVDGGTVMGTGTFGDLTVNGGIIAPGNSIGTMTVNGAFTLGAGAVYEVEVNAAGENDKVIVNGTVNLTGSVLHVLAANGNYKTKTKYTIIDNDGADPVTGTFAAVSSSLAFLTPTVIYNGGTGNDVVLTLSKNSTLFQDVAKTRNQKAVAGALDGFPIDNALYLAVLNQTADGARQAFDALSGEIYPTVAGVLLDDNRYVREAILGRLVQATYTNNAGATGSLAAGGPQVASLDTSAMALGYGDENEPFSAPPRAPLAFWTRAYGAWGNFDGNGNAATANRNLGGFVSGMDAQVFSSWRIGLATGASFSNVDVDARYSSAEVDSYHLGGYLGGMAGAFALRGGGVWAWSSIDTSRAVVFPGFYERQKASYDADTGQLFGEVAYPTQMWGMALEPFGGLAYVSVDTDNFHERGGSLASLNGRGTDETIGYTTVGLRAAQTTMWGAMQVTPHLSAAWQHAFDDVTPDAALAFASTGTGFTVYGVPLAEDSALIDTGLDLSLGPRTTAGVSYSGQFGERVTDNAVKGRFTWLF